MKVMGNAAIEIFLKLAPIRMSFWFSVADFFLIS